MSKEKVSVKPGTLMAPIPAVMVSCGDEKESNIITIAWTGIINSEPPLTYVSVRPTRKSHELIEKTGEFVINLVSEDLVHETDYCGCVSGHKVDKFKEAKLTRGKGQIVSCPIIEESRVNLECKVVEVRKYGTHDMFVGEIVAVDADKDLFDDKGALRLDKAGLVAYSHGHYYGLKPRSMGSFGYSVMKPKTAKKRKAEGKPAGGAAPRKPSLEERLESRKKDAEAMRSEKLKSGKKR
ncbi:MAG: flavin reductase family protein [Firmicutes bacterium]|nr:flavin reductase family protein [Bacillota bacterium]